MIRLVDGDGIRSGRVEILHYGTWGAICDNGWDMREARIVCHQLGFLEAEEATIVSLEESEEEIPIVMNRVSCKGSERHLVDCPFVCSSIQRCNSSRVAGVTCKPSENASYSIIAPSFFMYRLWGDGTNGYSRHTMTHSTRS